MKLIQPSGFGLRGAPQPTTRRQFLKLAAAGPACLAAPALAAPPACLRSPYVQNVSATGATILWTLGSPLAATVSLSDDLGREQHSAAAEVRELRPGHYLYRASFAGLRPDTEYRYELRCEDQAIERRLTAPPRFRTARAGSAFSFLHIADSGTGAPVQYELAARMLREGADFVLANGDLAYDLATHDSVEEYYFRVYRELMAQIPFFATLGNHEYWTDDGQPSLLGRVSPSKGVPARDRGRYYSFDWGNAHFVALDSNDPLARADRGDAAMLAWLEEDLRATRKFWRVAFFHHPPHATGSHQFGPEADQVRRHIVPILERYGVQLVLCGHEHNYQRTLPMLGGKAVPDGDGIVYITSGGGGQSTYLSALGDWMAQVRSLNHYLRSSVAGCEMTVAAVDPDGEVFDSVRLAPRPRIADTAREAASASTRLAAGCVAMIFGSNLCQVETRPAPSTVNAHGTSLQLGGQPVPILYADANQINFQAPFGRTGSGDLTVVTPNGSYAVRVNVVPVAPAFFLAPDGSGHALAIHADGTLVCSDSPAGVGEWITLLMTGLGAVDGFAEAGVLPPAPLPVRADVYVSIGGAAAEVSGAVLSPAYLGVYEVRIRVPETAAPGASVQVIASGEAGDPALLAIA